MVMHNLNLSEIKQTQEYLLAAIKSYGIDNASLSGVGIVLGSGLSGFVDKLDVILSIKYADIPHFGSSVLPGHKHQLTFAKLKNSDKVMCILEGRLHYYDGFTVNQVVYPVVALHSIGVERIIITNAAGGCNPQFTTGDLMVVKDHINFTAHNPLIGFNHDILGPRFLDQTTPYDHILIEQLCHCAKKLGINLQHGVYIGLSGPTYETAAEIRAFRHLGADAVGMSTVHEVIMANYLGMRVAAISCITNMATGLAHQKHSHEEVIQAAVLMSSKMSNILLEMLS